jgi:SAV_6107-like HEPN
VSTVTITTENTAAATEASAQVPAPRSPLRAATATADRALPGGRGRPAGPRVAPAPTSRAALSLLRQATDGLAEAHRTPEPLLRYPAAYLAALRAGAAVLAVRARPQPRRGASRNVWQLLAEIAPEFAEWAAFFASCSDTRAAAEAGIARLVGQREADDLLRQAEQFVGLVTASIPLR